LNNYNFSELSNGIQVVTETIPYLKSFSLGFWYKVGTRDENEKINGISHFLEHMLFKGTTKRSARKISEDIESCGGYLNAFTSKEHTCIYGRGLGENLEKTFAILSDMVQNPLLKDSHIKKEAGVIIDELNDINDNPEELIFDKIEEVLFKGNTLSYPIIGTKKNILNINNSNLMKFHSSHYGSDNLLISASGDLKHEQIIKLVEKYFRKSARTNKSHHKFLERSYPKEVTIDKDINQVHSILGKRIPGYKDSGRVKYQLLSNLLGESSSSRLFQAVREKLGITYQINSFLNSYQDISVFGVYFSTNDKQAEKVQSIIFKEFQKLRENKISEKELNRTKEYLIGSIILGLESTNNRMMRLANSILYFNKIITIEEQIERIKSVTAEDLISISDRILNKDDYSRIFVRSNNKAKNAA
jgi:predicted Zn-dependent peptidase